MANPVPRGTPKVHGGQFSFIVQIFSIEVNYPAAELRGIETSKLKT